MARANNDLTQGQPRKQARDRLSHTGNYPPVEDKVVNVPMFKNIWKVSKN